MRPLKLHFPDNALPTLDTFIKQTKEARVFRRAHAVRHVVQGQRLQTVADALSFTSSALRKWVYRFAHQGVHGLVERPRSGRPPQVTGALAQPLQRLVDQAPLQHGSIPSQWRCRELATVLAQQTGVHLGRERVRGVLKKRKEAPPVPPADGIPPPQTSRLALSHWLPSRTRRVGARSLCARKTKRSCGAVPCPARAGGVQRRVRASLYGR